jgi:DNA-binding HxlR family transcriptional regulator/putative sterol carrier protein
MASKRSYDDGCAAAHALDLIGERWALLVARELLLGPKRFSDLEATLPQISPNVLSQRLKDLEDIGVLTRHKMPAPAASWVYELTEWGYELEPVLQQLGRWGARSPLRRADAPISLATLVTAMKTMFYPPAAADLEASLELRIGDDRFAVKIMNGQLEIARGNPTQPDVTLTGDVATLGALAFGGLPLETAFEDRSLQVHGDQRVAKRFFQLFKLPEPVQSTAPVVSGLTIVRR